jgi:hypothetical protein
MKVGDVTCPACDAGFRGIELSSRMGAPSEYRCPVCNTLIEVLDASKDLTYRLTVVPTKLPGEPLGRKRR